MGSIVNDVLDMSKLQSGRMALETVNFDLHSMVNTMVRTAKLMTQSKPVDILSDIDKDVPRFLLGDPTRLHQVGPVGSLLAPVTCCSIVSVAVVSQILLNLISNAIKVRDRSFGSLLG